MEPLKNKIRVGDFHFDPHSHAITKDNQIIKVEPQVAQLLGLFIEESLFGDANAILSKEQIIGLLWPNRVVSDDALRAAIKKLREALGDNAKSPRYIKTLPLKGYKLICEVIEVGHKKQANHAQSNIHFSVLLRAISIIFILSVFCAAVWLAYVSLKSSSQPTVSKLTQIAGSELRPSFDNVGQRILFSHRENKDDFLQMYVKYLNDQTVTRLTWDEANYASMKWAPTGDRFVYTRSTLSGMQHYLSEFDKHLGLLNIRKLGDERLNNFYLLGWSHTQNAVYLTDKHIPSVPQAIWRYNLETKELVSITAPNVPGRGDHFAQESADGELLAVLRTFSLNKHELFVLHLKTGEIVHTQPLSQRMDRLIWNENNREITMGNFQGVLLTYDLDSKSITDNTPDIEFANHVFFQCGKRCYFMRQHTGNYLDIAEQPNPFTEQILPVLRNFELAGANDFPMYAHTNKNLYFVSQYNDSTQIEYFDEQGQSHTLKKLAAGSQMQSITLNSNDDVFVGLLDSRLFTYQVSSDVFEWMSTENNIVYPPHWVDQTRFRYARLEKNQIALYQYSLVDESTTYIEQDYVFSHQLSKGRTLRIDSSFEVTLTQNNQTRTLTKLPSTQANRFKIVGDTLYYTDRIENSQYLFALSVSDGTLSKALLAKNRFKANFDFSPDFSRLAVVKSLLAQSDLVKVELND